MGIANGDNIEEMDCFNTSVNSHKVVINGENYRVELDPRKVAAGKAICKKLNGVLGYWSKED